MTFELAIKLNAANAQDLGATIKLEVALPDGQVVQVHLPRERFDELKLQPGDLLNLRPREPHVFQEDYSI